jgi:hypothetical protein
MGADFLCTFVFIKTNYRPPKNWRKIVTAYSFSDKEIEKFCENWPLSDTSSDCWKHTQENIVERLIEFFTMIRVCPRDMCCIEIKKGTNMVISAGESWGDDPTESFTTINLVTEIPNDILRELGIKTWLEEENNG